MASENKKERLQIFYVRWDSNKPLVCSNCGSEVQFLYNNGGRVVITLTGKIKLYINYYSCQNKACKFSEPFTLPQTIVIPHKHYGLDIWTWIITSHIEFHDSYSSIAARLDAYYGLQISPNTVKSIIETYLAANSQEADLETWNQVQESGKIYLALDGQRPNNGECGLWLFIDTITDRVLYMEYIKSATWKILAEIFQKIERKYGTKIQAVISDHQRSIIKAVQEALSAVPHQFCHYHFIKNLHRGIDALDSHLHLELSSEISRILSGNLKVQDSIISSKEANLTLRALMNPIVEDLRNYDVPNSRDFDYFAGFQLYQNLESYINLMSQLLDKARSLPKFCHILEKMKASLQKVLTDQKPLFLQIEMLLPFFNEMRAILGQSSPSSLKLRAEAESWHQKIEEALTTLVGRKSDEALKYKRISYQSSLVEVLEEWKRLYLTHKEGLFHYCNLPGLPRANVALEQLFSLETRHFREASGNAHVGHLVRVKGGEVCQALLNYDPAFVKELLVKQDKSQWQSIIQQFRSRQKAQSNSWHSKSKKQLYILALLEKMQLIT